VIVMTKKLLGIASAVVVLAGALPAQVHYGGYFAAEFVKGQSQSDYPQGSGGRLQGGLVAGATLSSRWSFGLEVRYRGDSTFSVEQAWAGFVPSAAFNLKVGLFLVPFGIYNRANRPHETVFIRTPLNLEFLYPESWRELGASVEGQIGIFGYAAYIGNGLKTSDALPGAQQFEDNNKNKAWGGRLGLTFSQSLRAGASYYRGKYDDADALGLTLEGIDVSWVTAQWEVRAEITKGFVDNAPLPDATPVARGKTEGFTVWAVMNFRQFQPVGSYQKVKYADPARGDVEAGGIVLDRSRWTAGLRYVISNSIYLKAEYNWNKDKPAVPKRNQFQVQAAVAF
jgi:hypothetical protein